MPRDIFCEITWREGGGGESPLGMRQGSSARQAKCHKDTPLNLKKLELMQTSLFSVTLSASVCVFHLMSFCTLTFSCLLLDVSSVFFFFCLSFSPYRSLYLFLFFLYFYVLVFLLFSFFSFRFLIHFFFTTVLKRVSASIVDYRVRFFRLF